MADDLGSTISTNAQGPSSVTGDEGSMSQHSLGDQIEADKYIRGKNAQKSTRLPIRLAKIKAGGSI